MDRQERIDTEEPSDADFAATFADLARVNRFLGGTRAVLRPLSVMARTAPDDGTPLRILDIATGSADIPREIVRAARRGLFGTGRTVEIVATDNHSKVLALAERLTPPSAYPEIRVASADALALPYPDGAFDFALCSLAFHHLGPENCIRALREMERVTTRGFLVNDLLRDRLAAALIWLVSRALFAHPFTRHDGPASVMRAYTRDEYAAMARDAGLPSFTVHTAPMYRAIIVRDKRHG